MNDHTITHGTKQSFLEKAIFALLLGMTFLAPIFFLPVQSITTQFGTSLLFGFAVIVAALVYFVLVFMRSSIEIPVPRKVLWFIGAVPLVYLLAGIANGFSRMSFLGYTFDISTVGFILLGFVYVLLVAIQFRSHHRIFYSYFAFLVSSILFALFMLVRLVFGAKVLSFGIFTDLTSTVVGSWNNVSIFFGLCALLSLLTYYMLRVSTLMKGLLIAAGALSLFYLALVNFSTMWFILGTVSLLFIMYSMFARHEENFSGSIMQRVKRAPIGASILFLVSIIFSLWGTSISNRLTASFDIANIEVRPSLGVTLNIIKSTLQARPLFGSGPNTFVTQWLSYRPDDITLTNFWNTDFSYGIGLIPTFVVTTGLIGLAAWLAFFGFYIYFGVKAMFSRIADDFSRYLVVSSFFSSLLLWIAAWVYVPSTVILILTFFFTGLFFASLFSIGVFSVAAIPLATDPKKGFVSSIILVVLFVAFGTLGYGLIKNSESVWYFQKSSYALNTQGDVTAAETYMKKAIASVPTDIYYRSLAQIELVKLSAILSQDTTKVKTEEIQKQFMATLPDAINAAIAARDRDPMNYLNWIALGQVYEAVVPLKIEGAYPSAQIAYNEALRRNPKNPGIVLLFSRLALDGGDLQNARQYALQAIQAKQNYLDAYYLLAQIEIADKNIKGALDSLTAATVLTPNDPALFFQIGVLKYNAQDFTGAAEALEKAVALTPAYANAKYFLGLSYEILGKHSAAIEQFKDLAAANPDNKEVADILAALQAGKSIFTSPQTAAASSGTQKTLPVKER